MLDVGPSKQRSFVRVLAVHLNIPAEGQRLARANDAATSGSTGSPTSTRGSAVERRALTASATGVRSAIALRLGSEVGCRMLDVGFWRRSLKT